MLTLLLSRLSGGAPTSGQPIAPLGSPKPSAKAQAKEPPGGGAGGALSHVTGIARYGCFTPDTPVLMADGTRRLIHSVCG